MKNIFKKIIVSTYITFILVSFFTPFNLSFAQQSNCLSPNVYTKDGKCVKPMDPYIFLAPLPCPDNDANCAINAQGQSELKGFNFNPNVDSLGVYLNLVIKIIIGLSAVLAVVMIVIGGMEYMTSDLVSSKEAGKDRIRDALLGLVIALGAYTLLFTINPNLLSTNINIPEAVVRVEIGLDEANFSRTEKTATQVGTKYVSGAVNPAISAFISAQKPLTHILVNTANRKASFCTGPTTCVLVDINIGSNGAAETGQAQALDAKTPKGTTTISGAPRIGNNGNAILSGSGYNLGAVFVNTGATIGGKDRGIGFHGSYDNNLGTTNGCIRMRNEDLIALAPFMKAGVRVTIQ